MFGSSVFRHGEPLATFDDRGLDDGAPPAGTGVGVGTSPLCGRHRSTAGSETRHHEKAQQAKRERERERERRRRRRDSAKEREEGIDESKEKKEAREKERRKERNRRRRRRRKRKEMKRGRKGKERESEGKHTKILSKFSKIVCMTPLWMADFFMSTNWSHISEGAKTTPSARGFIWFTFAFSLCGRCV